MSAIWDFRQSWVYSLLNEMLKLKETIVLNTRTEHIYSVLIV